MDGKLLLTLFGMLFLAGMGSADPPLQQDMNTLHKDRRIAVVNELIKAQEQISKALWKMYKSTSPPGEQVEPDGADCSEESTESTDEEAYTQMKQNKIKEARENVHSHVVQIAKNLQGMNIAIDKIDKKIEKETKDRKSVINYSLYLNKRPDRGNSEEHSMEQGNKRPQSYRTSRHLFQTDENREEERQPEQVIGTVDGEEVVKTLPE